VKKDSGHEFPISKEGKEGHPAVFFDLYTMGWDRYHGLPKKQCTFRICEHQCEEAGAEQVYLVSSTLLQDYRQNCSDERI